MDKQTNKILMNCVENILQDENCPLFNDFENKKIYESYNGQISALGVSILMIGLCPTLAVYIQDIPVNNSGVNNAYRIFLLEIIARMLENYKSDKYGEILSVTNPIVDKYDKINCRKAYNLVKYIMNFGQQGNKEVYTDILNCSIALKEIIRTYTLK